MIYADLLRDRTRSSSRSRSFDAKMESCASHIRQNLISYFQYCRSLRFEDKPDYSYLKRLFRDLFIREGYQFDYVFDWTILKYPQIGVNPQVRSSGRTSVAVGTSHERAERTTMGQLFREKLPDAFVRKNASDLVHHNDNSKHKAPDGMPLSSKAHDSERPWSSSRNGSTSKRAVISSSRPSSSVAAQRATI
uniref:Non-specific serine/threonine protein kinase n=1 Tax=Ananas comosus var. bracteatus TaxID=296719 RepID=A0A6V7PJB0_ANACO|nr:unnamed protein product [Ananas comosus var. bracteatus]